MSGRQYGIAPGTRPDISPISSRSPCNRPEYDSPYDHSISPVASRPPTYRSSEQVASSKLANGQRNAPAHQPHESFSRVPIGRGAAGPVTLPSDYPQAPGASRALQDIDNLYGGRMITPSPEPYSPPSHSPEYAPGHRPTASQTSVAPLVAPRVQSPPWQSGPPLPPMHGRSTSAAMDNSSFENRMPRSQYYQGDGYDEFDPRDIADDGDDTWEERKHPHHRTEKGATATSTAVGGAGMLRTFGNRDPSGNYAPVEGERGASDPEKNFLQEEQHRRKRRKWIIASIIAVVVVLIVAGAVTGGILGSQGSSRSPSLSSASNHGKLYDIHSPQVKSLLNNKDLHRVFPGMDYTPLNAQYPYCITTPPDQNNITLDVAMMSQLTPAIRLYGTDCNQTEMVLTAIDQLGYADSMKVWIGVWLDKNETTNNRQLEQMYTVLDNYPSERFAGIIVGNEVLYREDMTAQELATVLSDVRSNMTAKGVKLPLSTSDLGDDWDASLAAESDIIMANVHPFFAGKSPGDAPGWTINFWETHDTILTPANIGKYPRSIISEVGWPSEGGTDCGTEDYTCPPGVTGAVASVENISTFLDGFVCQALQNGTHYFYFEAFDEPWKERFNSGADQWETHWGLMTIDHKLKDGVVIPDCGGKTASLPSW